MKKIDLILNGKVDAKLIEMKKAKISKAIEVAILNAEDDLLQKELEYYNAMNCLGEASIYECILQDMMQFKQDIFDIENGIKVLKNIQNDLFVDIDEE